MLLFSKPLEADPDISKIQSLVGFRPTVQLDEILAGIIEHFRTSTAR